MGSCPCGISYTHPPLLIQNTPPLVQHKHNGVKKNHRIHHPFFLSFLVIYFLLACSYDRFFVAYFTSTTAVTAANMHLDLGQAIFHLPLLLVQFHAHGGVLRLEALQALS